VNSEDRACVDVLSGGAGARFQGFKAKIHFHDLP